MDRAEAAERARNEVAMFENYLECVQSLHRDATSPWNWQMVAAAPPPQPPNAREQAATAALQAFEPTFFDKLLGKAKGQRAQLEAALNEARSADHLQHQAEMEQWDWYRRLAAGVLAGDTQAFNVVVDTLAAFEDIEEFGTRVDVSFSDVGTPEVRLTVTDPEVVPREELKLLASGKQSSKAMPQGKYWLLYQDHVCSAALRAARELFALIPCQTVFAHVLTHGLNSATGHEESVPVLSVLFDRANFSAINFARIDPSDAVSRFTHRMDFKKTAGFARVIPLSPDRVIEVRQ